MEPLVIKIKGEVQDSNFGEWSRSLVEQIRSLNTDLRSDDDFAVASRQVKSFKAAEKRLAEAKQHALEQASGINKLFAAIDEVSAEARQARLVLERQIKQRKADIKAEIIDNGIRQVQEYLAQQPAPFSKLDHSEFLTRQDFETAVKGKTGTRGVNLAVSALVKQKQRDIDEKVRRVSENALLLDELPRDYALLFQDCENLVGLPFAELKLTVDNRIAAFKSQVEHAHGIAPSAESAEHKNAANSRTSTSGGQRDEDLSTRYRIILEIAAQKEQAIDLAREVRARFEDHPEVTQVRLRRVVKE